MLLALMVACNAGGGETIDLIEGVYVGFPAEGDPVDGVNVTDADSIFEIEFYEHDRELWADLAFDGEMVIHWFVIKEENNTIEGVTVDGLDLTCVVMIEEFSFNVEGLFSSDFESLHLDVTSVGTMTLTLEEDEEVEDVGAA